MYYLLNGDSYYGKFGQQEYDKLLQLEVDIDGLVSGRIYPHDVVELDPEYGLCSNIDHAVFTDFVDLRVEELQETQEGVGDVYPILLTLDEVMEDLELRVNEDARRADSYDRDQIKVLAEYQYDWLDKYSGNFGRKRLKLLREFISSLEVCYE